MGTVVEFAARSAQGVETTTSYCRPHTVRLTAPAERAYWCRHFRATPEQLSSVVKQVGSNPAIVQMFLYRR